MTNIKLCGRCKIRPRLWGAYCQECGKEMARQSRKNRDNRGRPCSQCSQPITSKTGYLCGGCSAAKAAAARLRDPELTRRGNLRQKYGITLEQYQAMLVAQGGGCAICHKPPVDLPLCVDHDHACCPGKKSCGKCVRGLLCVYCNVTVGKLESQSFRDHVAYIEAWGGEVSLV